MPKIQIRAVREISQIDLAKAFIYLVIATPEMLNRQTVTKPIKMLTRSTEF
jgi:hypothetical protein